MIELLHNEARKLLVEGYEATHNAEAIAKIFHVNKYTVYHLEERKRKTGSVDLQTWRRGRKALLSSADKVPIAERITKNSTISLEELRTQLGLKVSISTMSRVVRALREAVFGGNMKDINLILENIVYMELLRRGYTVTVGKIGSREIDFVGQKQHEKLYVQVCYLLASDETIQREFGVYASVPDNFPKYVVSMDELDMSRDGIKHRNIRDFLTQREWN